MLPQAKALNSHDHGGLVGKWSKFEMINQSVFKYGHQIPFGGFLQNLFDIGMEHA